MGVQIGVDIGGTFTDVVAVGPDGSMRIAKLPSTRSDPSRAVRAVLADLLPEWRIPAGDVTRFVHGTTVATNAVLERKGARLGLLTSAGFEDVLEIGRQSRRQIYQLLLKPETPGFLAPGARRRGVAGAIGPDGGEVEPLDMASLESAVDALVAEGVEAIAIAFLFSFANPAHERAAAAFIRQRHPGIVLSLSSDVDPAFREYERSVVTAFDAYVKPGFDRYPRPWSATRRGRRSGAPADHAVARRRARRAWRASGPSASSCRAPPRASSGARRRAVRRHRGRDHDGHRRHELGHRARIAGRGAAAA